MVHNPLTIGNVIEVLECLKFYLSRISARNNLYIYTHPDCAIEIPIPKEINVISVQWVKRIIRKIEDCGISAEDMIKCGISEEMIS